MRNLRIDEERFSFLDPGTAIQFLKGIHSFAVLTRQIEQSRRESGEIERTRMVEDRTQHQED
jgi:hypothetical protein